jgi:hypothetical protein
LLDRPHARASVAVLGDQAQGRVHQPFPRGPCFNGHVAQVIKSSVMM